MSTGLTGELWVPGLKGLLGVREDGAQVYIGGYTLTTASLSNVAAEVDQFVPASGKSLTLNNTGTINGGDAWVLAIAAAKTLTVSNTLTLAGTDSTVMTFPSTSATIARTDAANTFTGTQTFSGAVSPTGGIAAGGGFTASPRLLHTGDIPARVSTDGTNATPSATETYIAEVFIPCNMTLTGVAVFNGATVGTDKHAVFLCDSAGTAVANTDTAGTTTSGADAYQRIAFTATYAAKGPATYYVALQMNGTTDRYNAHPFGNFGASKGTGTTFGTLASITVPTTFTADLGPIASLY